MSLLRASSVDVDAVALDGAAGSLSAMDPSPLLFKSSEQEDYFQPSEEREREREREMGSDLRLLPGLPDDVAMDCLARVPYRHHFRLRSVCRGWRNFVRDPSFYSQRLRSGAGEALVFLIQALGPPEKDGPEKAADEKIAAQRGYDLSVYNATLDEWRRLSLPLVVPLFAQCAAVQASGKIVLIGGWDPSSLDSLSDVFVIDLITGQGQRGASMRTARSFFACAAIGPLVYVAGGHDNQKNALRTTEVYDVVADEWRALPPMTDERDECQGVAIGGEFWVISGYSTDSQGGFVSSVECYDPSTGSWRKEEGLWARDDDPGRAVPPRSSCFVLPMPAAAGGGKLCHVLCNEGAREVREYAEMERKWNVVGDTPANLNSIPCVASIADEGRLLAVGADREYRHSAWMMDHARRKWTQVGTPARFAGFAYSASSIVI